MMEKTELQTIREELGISRSVMARLVGKGQVTIFFYETRRLFTPDSVLEKARKWRDFYREMTQEYTKINT